MQYIPVYRQQINNKNLTQMDRGLSLYSSSHFADMPTIKDSSILTCPLHCLSVTFLALERTVLVCHTGCLLFR